MLQNIVSLCSVSAAVLLILATLSTGNPATSTPRYILEGLATQKLTETFIPQLSILVTNITQNATPKLSINLVPRSEKLNSRKLRISNKHHNYLSHNASVNNDHRYSNKTLKIKTVSRLKTKTDIGSSFIGTTSKPQVNTVKLTPIKPSSVVLNLTKSTVLKSNKTPYKTQVTNSPFKIKLQKVPTSRPVLSSSHINDKGSGTTIRNLTGTSYTRVPTGASLTRVPATTTKPKRKPTVHRIVTKWSDRPTFSEIKQNWFENGVPYQPNPSPEISSYSPQSSINDVLTPVPLNPDSYDQQQPGGVNAPGNSIGNGPSNAISNFNLEMSSVPGPQGGNLCPTVHISSSMLPQARQDCSDLNLVINSHYHQNTATVRSPTPNAISTYDGAAPPAEDPGVPAAPAADPGVVAADPAPAGGSGGAPQAAPPPAPAAGGVGGSGGTGGNGGNGSDDGAWKFPDLKHMFEAIGYIWNGLGHLLGFLRNPYLYIIPMVLSFIFGFFKVLALFPWWIPALLIYAGAKSSHNKSSRVTVYKHVHKPIHHADGWFWNHDTKTWQNIQNYLHSKRVGIEDRDTIIEKRIDNFLKKYGSGNNPSWKWRRRNR